METYKLKIKVLSAVHIGSSSNLDISKYEYIKFPGDSKIIVIDEKKLFSILCEKGFEEKYFEFVQNASTGNNIGLYTFLTKNCNFSDFECKKLIESVKKYEIEMKEDKLWNIKTFVKDKLTNKVYIPASSLKGMIATALQSDIIKKEHKNMSDRKEKSEVLEKLKDYMSAISISDSSLIERENLFVSKISYVSPKKTNILNQCYEFLKPNTSATFTIKIDEEKIKIEKIQDVLKWYCELYEKNYADPFSTCNVKIENAEGNYIKCYLGAKTGLPTKTFYYQVDPETAPQKITKILDDIKSFQRMKGKNINKYGKSPICIKCIKLNDRLVENGAVELKFEKMEKILCN